jgi:hypothetical protein
MNSRLLVCAALLVAIASGRAYSQCPVGDDLFRFPAGDQPTTPLTPPPGLAEGTPAPGTIRPDVARRPYSAFGRLDTVVDGVNRYCTAQLVEGTNILVTAAHCVRNNQNGNWVSDFRFWRAADVDQTEPVRKPLCIATKKDWVGPPPANFPGGRFFWPADYAFIVFREALGQQFFRLGIDAPNRPVSTFGYPAGLGSHKTLIRVDGRLEKVPDFAMAAVEHTEPALALGMSGGAWVADLNEGEGSAGDVVGLSTTTGTSGGTSFLAGPLFAVCAKDLLEFVKTACAPQ